LTKLLAFDNRRTWVSSRLTRRYADLGHSAQGGAYLLFPAELAILGALWSELQGQPILELGVGGGRLVPFLRVLSDRYVALDWSPPLVAAAQQSYPQIDIRQGDARDLRAFPDASFTFVLFSYNGIDHVPYEDRSKVLDEVFRVVEPGGYFAFSTHNLTSLHGGTRGVYKPPRLERSSNPVRAGIGVARWAVGSTRVYAKHRRLRSAEHSGDGYAVLNDTAAHALLTCYVDPRAQCEALRRRGFAEPPQLFERDGRPGSVDSDDAWLHYLVRKPAGTERTGP
jgi:SAM-dependent methyltransferase